MRPSLAIALTFAFAACKATGLPIEEGTSSVPTTYDLAPPTKTPVDLAMPADLASMASVACGEINCGPGETCCVSPHQGMPQYACMATCDPNQLSLSCDGAEDCSSGACCVSLSGGMGGMGGNHGSGSASCESPSNDCSMGSIDPFGGTLQTKACHTYDDCQGYQGNLGNSSVPFDACCVIDGSSFMFCAPYAADGHMGITCSCPLCE